MKMRINKKIAVSVSIISIVAVAAAPTFHRTRPAVRCDIPVRDYQYAKLSQPLRSLSNVPIVISVPLKDFYGTAPVDLRGPADGKQLTVKSFQFVKDPILQSDHCSVSQMSVLLHESGRWTISLQANQNPVNPRQILDVTTAQPKQLFTDHLQRNEFHVVARCYSQYGPGDSNGLLGKPLVFPLLVRPFMVQRQQPYALFETGFHPDVQQYFGSIDRVEIEFAYKLD